MEWQISQEEIKAMINRYYVEEAAEESSKESKPE
jgi:hypothetical protein